MVQFIGCLIVFGGDQQEKVATASPLPAPTDKLAATLPFRILLADDNTVNQLVAKRVFERFGYSLKIVSTGLQAVEAARTGNYEVVFMDIQMPEMNGYEATGRIREILPADKQPWIVALTANSLESDRETCLQNGMNDFLTKPVRFAELETCLKAVPRRN
ncbi:response regulator [Oleiharenicola lentus]|uniref:response regulator n=1 Tax=Oleiharenicola lentus TaxID=2508720 RepID=UPI003F664E34